MGFKAAYIGTIGVINNVNCETKPIDLTTPGPYDIHEILAQLYDAGVTHVAMEASSHGLDQYRLHGVKFYGVAFTNLSREHFDYHGDMDTYFAAKKRLFTDFSPTVSVTNVDDPYGKQLQTTHQFGKGTPYYYEDGKIWANGKSVAVDTLQIIGEFQYHNLCCAMALMPEHDLITLAHKIKPVPGRFEKVHDKPLVIVDYAHKPEAMSVVLENLRPYTKGRLITLFGCGGNRDTGKRPLMGAIAHKLSDIVIVTDDNPRFEDPKEIRRQILQACPNAKEFSDRAEAIRYAASIAMPDDSIAILGKGHENYQKIQDTTVHFDDCEVARHAFLS